MTPDPQTTAVLIDLIIIRWHQLYPDQDVPAPMLRRLAFATLRRWLAGAPLARPAVPAAAPP